MSCLPVPSADFTRADLARLLSTLPSPWLPFADAARVRQGQLTKPPGALGQLEDVAVFLAGWSMDGVPRASRGHVAVFAGNHGIAARGVSPYPAAVTAQMVANFRTGGAAINALARANDLTLAVHALELDRPTGDISTGPAMSDAETLTALSTGFAAVPDDIDVLIVGEMGIANTTIAAALAARVFGGSGVDWAGAGTGHNAAGISLKARMVDAALARHADTPRTALDTLAAFGGRELAALAGAVLGARHKRVPVLLDGFVVSAALATLVLDQPAITSHCLAAHASGEQAHRRLLAELGLAPALLDLGMRLGEGSGAAVAFPLLRAAVAAHTGMATFEQAAVSNRA